MAEFPQPEVGGGCRPLVFASVVASGREAEIVPVELEEEFIASFPCRSFCPILSGEEDAVLDFPVGDLLPGDIGEDLSFLFEISREFQPEPHGGNAAAEEIDKDKMLLPVPFPEIASQPVDLARGPDDQKTLMSIEMREARQRIALQKFRPGTPDQFLRGPENDVFHAVFSGIEDGFTDISSAFHPLLRKFAGNSSRRGLTANVLPAASGAPRFRFYTVGGRGGMSVCAGTDGQAEVAVDTLRFVGRSRREKSFFVQTDRKKRPRTDTGADSASEAVRPDGGDSASFLRLLRFPAVHAHFSLSFFPFADYTCTPSGFQVPGDFLFPETDVVSVLLELKKENQELFSKFS